MGHMQFFDWILDNVHVDLGMSLPSANRTATALAMKGGRVTVATIIGGYLGRAVWRPVQVTNENLMSFKSLVFAALISPAKYLVNSLPTPSVSTALQGSWNQFSYELIALNMMANPQLCATSTLASFALAEVGDVYVNAAFTGDVRHIYPKSIYAAGIGTIVYSACVSLDKALEGRHRVVKFSLILAATAAMKAALDVFSFQAQKMWESMSMDDDGWAARFVASAVVTYAFSFALPQVQIAFVLAIAASAVAGIEFGKLGCWFNGGFATYASDSSLHCVQSDTINCHNHSRRECEDLMHKCVGLDQFDACKALGGIEIS